MKWVFSFSFLAVLDSAMAQKLEIGVVDYYGLSSPGAPAKSQVEACLAFKVGELIDSEGKNVWKDQTISCKKLPDVKQATLEGVCCDLKNKVMIFVGVSQQAAPPAANRSFTSEENFLQKLLLPTIP